jgi:hypothetical protein
MGRKLTAVILFVMALSAVDLMLTLAAGEDESDTAAYVRVGLSVLVGVIAIGIYLRASRKESQSDTPDEAGGDGRTVTGGERRHPVRAWATALFIALTTILLTAIPVFLSILAYLDWDDDGRADAPGKGVALDVVAGVVLLGGLWCAWRVGSGGWGRWHRPVAARPLPATAPAPTAAPSPAVFIPCPGCGRTVNKEVGRCPYCRAVLDAGGRP